MVFKRILIVLLLFILLCSCICSVSATHYTYKVNITQYETFDLDDWMDSNDISGWFDSSFSIAFQKSDYFLTFVKTELSSDIYVTAIKPGNGTLTFNHFWPFDDAN
jgi:hypothetical protein